MIKTSVNTGQTIILVAASALLLVGAPLRASQTDDRIESSAKKSYVFKHYLTDDSIKTESKNGVVTLTGTVAEESHIGLASDTVSGLPGVKSVDNQLTVKGEAPAKHSDTWIALKVKTALLFHRNVRATKTDVNVKDGIVTLSGEASSMAQKELTTEYAKDIDNVKEVKNEMTIAKTPAKPDETVGEKIDDASITAQVKASLLSHQLDQRPEDEGRDDGWRGHVKRHCQERRRKEPRHQAGHRYQRRDQRGQQHDYRGCGGSQ